MEDSPLLTHTPLPPHLAELGDSNILLKPGNSNIVSKEYMCAICKTKIGNINFQENLETLKYRPL